MKLQKQEASAIRLAHTFQANPERNTVAAEKEPSISIQRCLSHAAHVRALDAHRKVVRRQLDGLFIITLSTKYHT